MAHEIIQETPIGVNRSATPQPKEFATVKGLIRRPAELDFSTLLQFSAAKQGVSVESILKTRHYTASYYEGRLVIAFEVINHTFEPTGYQLYRADGKDFPGLWRSGGAKNT